MLKYTISNKESGEVRELEVNEVYEEAKKAHRTFRKILRTDLGTSPDSKIEVDITGKNTELVNQFKEKAYNYIAKNYGGAHLTKKAKDAKVTNVKPDTKPPEKPKFELVVGERIMEAFNEGLLTIWESKVMEYLMTEGYYAEYMFSDITVSDIAEELETEVETMKGVVGSLVKKGYLTVGEQEDGIPPMVYATVKGYKLSDEYEERWKEEIEDAGDDQ